MRWVTYFSGINRFHLTKDVGLIPFYAGQNGFESLLLGHFKNDLEIPAEVEGLQTECLPDEGRKFFLDRSFLNWLRRHATQVDVLQLFHLSRDTIFYGAYYKRLNPEGKLYLKLDAYNDHLKQRKRYARGALKNLVMRRVEKRFFRNLDLATVENLKGLSLAKASYPELEDILDYMPNGCNDFYLSKRFPQTPKKEKLILSVGRLGSPDKNFELLLKALPHIKFRAWRMEIVGPESAEFKKARLELFAKHPELNERVNFTGAIYDREVLYEKYARASVFFLPSRFESFGISFVEALYFGACLVGNPMMYAYPEISANGKFGLLFEENDVISFIAAMEDAMERSSTTGFAEAAMSYGREQFSWSRLFQDLIGKLEDA